LEAYQADIAKFKRAGSQVIGISVDSRERNKAFAQKLGVQFPILSDEDKRVSEAYGVLYPLIRIAKRTTFIIDQQGVIRAIQTGGEAADPSNSLPVCDVLPR
jgi:thioredoxin-dependent peroxiredoxin